MRRLASHWSSSRSDRDDDHRTLCSMISALNSGGQDHDGANSENGLPFGDGPTSVPARLLGSPDKSVHISTKNLGTQEHRPCL